jgi:hypothetical protein
MYLVVSSSSKTPMAVSLSLILRAVVNELVQLVNSENRNEQDVAEKEAIVLHLVKVVV